jgi:hypothetical protein
MAEHMRKHPWVSVLFVLAACGESSIAPKADNGAEFVSMIATLGGSAFAGTPLNGTVEVPCPAGGTRVLSGNGSSTQSGDVVSSSWQASSQHRDCAIVLNSTTLVTSGSSQSQGQVTMRVPASGSGRPTILQLQARDTGTMTTKVGNETHTCAFDLSQTYNASTNQVRVKGTACGESVDFLRGM